MTFCELVKIFRSYGEALVIGETTYRNGDFTSSPHIVLGPGDIWF